MKQYNNNNNLAESVGVINERELNENSESYVMSDNERDAYTFYIKRFQKAKDQRDQVFEEFDDQYYEQDYLNNQRAMVSYLRKKINDSDVRVNTGTTEKRIETVLNELMTMNLQPEVRAFDQEDKELVEIGDCFGDLVKRTNEIENDEDKRLEMYIELLSQRALFVEEIYTERKTRNGKRTIRMCEKRLVPGLQVYLGDITIPASRFDEQPFRLKYKRMTYDEAKTIYGDFNNWKYVKPGMFDIAKTNNIYDFRMGKLGQDEVEIIDYISVIDDECQIMINGILMYEPGHKLPWDHDGDNMTMIVLKPIHPRFAYGKPLTASAKTLQALNDESVRNVVRKWRQAIDPPMGVKNGKIYSKDIWNPGAMTQGLVGNDFSVLNPNNTGLSQSDTAMLQFIEQKTNEFIGTSVLQSSPTKRMTATEIIQQQKLAIKMLGLSVLSAMRLVRNLTYFRIYNIIENEVKPVKRQFNTFTKELDTIYRSFTVNEATIDGDKLGKKVIGFMDRTLNRQEEEAIYEKEQDEYNKGNVTRYNVINIKKLREIRPNWYVVVINKERDSSELSKAMFTEKISQAVSIMQITGRKLNSDNVIESFERTWQDKNLFQRSPSELESQDPNQLLSQIQGLKGKANENVNKGLNQGVTEGEMQTQNRPTVNTMANSI